MGLIFEWDPRKARSNFEKHGVRFEEAMTVFEDERAITIFDFGHSKDEDRFVDLGRSKNGNILSVVYTEREDRIRLIHARRANREERRFYETSK
jgi:uncharacterized DUF497 family protein